MSSPGEYTTSYTPGGPEVIAISRSVALPVSSVALAAAKRVGVHASRIISSTSVPAWACRVSVEQSIVLRGFARLEIRPTQAFTTTGSSYDAFTSQRVASTDGHRRFTNAVPSDEITVTAAARSDSTGPRYVLTGSADARETRAACS